MVIADRDLLIDPDSTPLHTAHRDSTHIFIVIDGGNQHLHGAVHIPLRGRNIVHDGLEQRDQVGAHLIGAVGSRALTAGTEDRGGVKLLVGGVQVQ